MKLRTTRSRAIDRPETIMRHELVIGPLCDSAFFGRKARFYYCNRCKWSFLVCGRKVAVLDAGGGPLNGNSSSTRFSADEDPCPVLETFASDAMEEASVARAMLTRTQRRAQQAQSVF
jgi:hypothetical protein